MSETIEHECWLCKKKDGRVVVETKPEPPDNDSWWFHHECYWKLQEIIYG